MSDREGADLVEEVGVEGQPAPHGLAFEPIGAGRHKLQAEEVRKELADLAVRHVELVTQVDRGGFSRRADIGTEEFARAGQQDLAVTLGTVSLLMDKAGRHHARFQDDVLLEVLPDFRHRPELGALAMGAASGCRNRHDAVDQPGLGPPPGRVAPRCAALLFQNGGGVWWGGGAVATLELAAVQSLKLGFELLDLPFLLPGQAARLVQFLAELLEDVFVVALGSGDGLITVPDPLGRQALQIGAPVAVATNKLFVQFGEARHGC